MLCSATSGTYRNAVEAARRIYVQEGLFAFYKGIVPAMYSTLLRSVVLYEVSNVIRAHQKQNLIVNRLEGKEQTPAMV